MRQHWLSDSGTPNNDALFARRVCDVSESNCVGRVTDTGPISTTDDFITARVTMDNNTASPCSVSLTLLADRSVINSKLTPRDVTLFFGTCGGAVADPNDANNIFELENQKLGIRKVAGYYDNNTEAGGYFYSQNPIQTGDNLSVRFDAIDLQNRTSTPTPYRLSGLQYVSGEFGASGLPGTDAVELRFEDPVIPGASDLSPSGLLRGISTVGDLGNADGIPSGAAPTTVTSDFTDVVVTPGHFALANNLFGMVYLNPGDNIASVTAIGATGGGDVLIGNSQVILGCVLPINAFSQNDFEIRLDMEGELGTTSPNLGNQGGTSASTLLRTHGQFIAIDKNRNRLE